MLSFLGLFFITVLIGDMGLYNLIKTGDNKDLSIGLIAILCMTPILIPVSILGAYVQLSYQDKISQTVISIARKNQKK